MQKQTGMCTFVLTLKQ